MPRIVDYTGKTFNRLTVLHRDTARRYNWVCRCTCGVLRSVTMSNVIRGVTKSCGCLKRERDATDKSLRRKHPNEYGSFISMRRRCWNKHHEAYHRYGGVGIVICPRWCGRGAFARFLADMGCRPSGYTLERNDNTKWYGPDNCRWATRLEQTLNRSTTKWITFHGVTQCLTWWARASGMCKKTLVKRLRVEPVDQVLAVTIPVLVEAAGKQK